MGRPKGQPKTGGRKRGTLNKLTMEKQAIRDFIREKVSDALGPLVDAQVANAKGLKYLVARDPKTGKFERISAGQIDGKRIIEVWEKDPSIQAFTDLLNRAADKPIEPVEVSIPEPIVLTWQK